MQAESRGILRRVALPVALGVAGTLGTLWTMPILFGAPAPLSEEPAKTLATINGLPVLQSEVEAESAEQLTQIDLQRQQCAVKADEQRHGVLTTYTERVVRQKLMALEAERVGETSEALADSIRTSAAEITTEDVDAWWEKNKDRVQQPREDVEEQITALLAREELQNVEQQYFDGLKERYEVEMMLDPFRLEVMSAGFPSIGPEDAAVTIVEFSDFECPYCQKVLPTIDQVKSNYPDNVRVVFRQFPLTIHKNARKAAEASLCARDQGKFWEMHDLMFEEQRALTVAELKEKAERLELDQVAFDSCLDSGRYDGEISHDLREGAVVGVTGTPALFVNGRKLSGAVDFETVAKVIDDELARANREG